MTKRGTPWKMPLILLLVLPWLTLSCAKKVVQKEEVTAPQETPKAEMPAEVQPKPTPPPPSAIEEETLSAAERKRKEEEFRFENQDIHFDFDRYDLKPEAREILADKAFFLKKYPTVKILIEGHCDERGTNEYNLALGERRANSAKQYLINLGISEDRISTISYGEERPLDPGHNEAAWAKNRRAHFVIISR